VKYASRKFIAAIVVITIASVALFMGKITDTGWIAAVNIALGLYVGANVAQKGVTKDVPPEN
jgi:hypothetical protein